MGYFSWSKVAAGSADLGVPTAFLGYDFHLPDAKWNSGFEKTAVDGNTIMTAGFYGNGLKLDKSDKLKSGTVTALYFAEIGGGDSSLLYDVRISASTIKTAAGTSSMSDDYKIISDAFSGDDFIMLRGNSINARNGNDLIFCSNDDEYVLGGAGHDVLAGMAGDDRLYGGNGNDVLYGDGGADRLLGGKGNDTIWAGTGNDTLKGGAGRDVFLFGGSFGRDVIGDFQDGTDRIALLGARSMADVNIVSLGNGRSRIEVDGGGSILINVGQAKLGKADFVFGLKAAALHDEGLETFFDQWDYT
ncbi:calcium-binding protein [Gemmobacter serpentinus]|uniref:calcium-binding protein n=1 Tax=Gemmobacter serpentinus TaxID=2652247 RepID=UPI00186573AF|nr:calcium-binding protein [Gemmobacter serpentinus]